MGKIQDQFSETELTKTMTVHHQLSAMDRYRHFHFRGSRLEGPDGRGSRIEGSRLERFGLEGARLERSRLERTRLEGVYLYSAVPC